MVDARRYLAHHEEEAERIRRLLSQFGSSGDAPVFWCNMRQRISIFDCIHCERYNHCHHDPPPLYRRYDPDDKGWKRYLGDMGMQFLIEDRGPEDWVWLQHPETRRR